MIKDIDYDDLYQYIFNMGCEKHPKTINAPTITFLIMQYTARHFSFCSLEMAVEIINILLSLEFIVDTEHSYYELRPLILIEG